MKFEDCTFPKDRYYLLNNTPNHFWALDSDGTFVSIGLNDFFQKRIGKIKSVTLKAEIGKSLVAGKTLGLVKAENYSAILKAPFSAEISHVNDSIKKKPSLINNSPYDEGWLIKLKFESPFKENLNKNWVTSAENLKSLKKFIDLEIKNNSLLADDCCPDLLGGSKVVRRRKK